MTTGRQNTIFATKTTTKICCAVAIVIMNKACLITDHRRGDHSQLQLWSALLQHRAWKRNRLFFMREILYFITGVYFLHPKWTSSLSLTGTHTYTHVGLCMNKKVGYCSNWIFVVFAVVFVAELCFSFCHLKKKGIKVLHLVSNIVHKPWKCCRPLCRPYTKCRLVKTLSGEHSPGFIMQDFLFPSEVF